MHGEIFALRLDVAIVEIDEDGPALDDIVRPGRSCLHDRSGDDEDPKPLACHPRRAHEQPFHDSVDPRKLEPRLAVAGTGFGKKPDWYKPLKVAEYNLAVDPDGIPIDRRSGRLARRVHDPDPPRRIRASKARTSAIR
jgi:hypothetical protein